MTIQTITVTVTNVTEPVPPVFGLVPDRMNMLHPAEWNIDTTALPGGFNRYIVADHVNQWMRNGSATTGDNAVTLGLMALAPDGSSTAQKIIESSLNQTHHLSAGCLIPFGFQEYMAKFRLAVYAKAGERTRILLEIKDNPQAVELPNMGSHSSAKALFDLVGGQVVNGVQTTGGPRQVEGAAASIVAQSGGWYLCILDVFIGPWTFAQAIGHAGSGIHASLYLDSGSGLDAESVSYDGDGTSGIYVWKSNLLPTRAWELNQLGLFDDFEDYSTIDTENTRQPGFTWYVAPAGGPKGGWPGFSYGTDALRKDLDYSVTDSVLLLGHTQELPGEPVPLGQFETACYTGSQTYVGNVWTAPYYVESRQQGPSPTATATWWTVPPAVLTYTSVDDPNNPIYPNFERDFTEEYLAQTNNLHATTWHPELGVAGEWLSTNLSTNLRFPDGTMPNFAEWHTFSQVYLVTAAGVPAYAAGQRNILPNSGFSGAVPGTPGTLPTRMSIIAGGGGFPAGLNVDVVSLIDGKLQMRVHGTVASSSIVSLRLNDSPISSSNGTIAQGQLWTASIKLRLVSGTLPSIKLFGLYLRQHDAAGNDLIYTNKITYLPSVVAPVNRYSSVMNTASVNCARVGLELIVPVPDSGAVDYTFEMSEPQLERSAAPSPFQPSIGGTSGDTQGVEATTLEQAEPHVGYIVMQIDRLPMQHRDIMYSNKIAMGNLHMAFAESDKQPGFFTYTIDRADRPAHVDYVRIINRGSGIYLSPLGLSANTLPENATEGTEVGTIVGVTSGSAITMTDTAGGRFKLVGNAVQAGAVATDYETTARHNITLRETLAGAVNSPRDTMLAITVADIVDLPPPSSATIDMNFAANTITGAAAFTDVLACDRASTGYAQTVAGALTSFAINTLRRTDKGLLIEEAKTNIVLWNRDLTNAVWTKSGITAAKDQTGPDGVASSATSLTATGANGTVLQSITLASDALFSSVYVKRITGSGVINMTMDNGATWTVISVTSSWTRASIPAQTLANPTVGFRIVTSGDAIAIDFVQTEAAAFASSPIETTTVSVTRASDVVSPIGALDTAVDAATGTLVISLEPAPQFGMHLVSSADPAILFKTSGADLKSWSGSTMLVIDGLANHVFNAGKYGCAWSAAGRSITGQGLAPVSDASVKSTPSSWYIGSAGTSGYLNSYIPRLQVWDTRLSDATLQSATT